MRPPRPDCRNWRSICGQLLLEGVEDPHQIHLDDAARLFRIDVGQLGEVLDDARHC